MEIEIGVGIIFLLCAAYFIAGFVDSIAGGGGLIGIPVFLLTGISPDYALGTNKLAACLGTSCSLITYSQKGYVLWRLSAIGVPAALLGGFLGSKAILYFDVETIGKMIVILLPLAIFITLAPKKISNTDREVSKKRKLFLTPLVCFMLGFYDGFLGPGTGSFFILAFHYFLGLGLVKASATSKIFNLATGISSFVAFALHGKVLYFVGIPLAFSNIAGNFLGSKMAINIGEKFVRKNLIFTLTLLFITLLWKLIISKF